MNRNMRREARNAKRGYCLGFVAHGNDLVAQNEEPEPDQGGGSPPPDRNLAAEWTGLTEADLQLGDVDRNTDKAWRRVERDTRYDLERAINERRGHL